MIFRCKKIIAVFLAAIICLSLAGCGENAESGEKKEAKATVSFTDDAGRTVEIPESIERIVPSGSLAQLILFALAPEKFVGLSSMWDADAEEIIGEEYYNLPYYGQFYGSGDMDIEELAKAEPDIVIDIGESKEGNVEYMDDFTAQTGIPMVFIEAHLDSMGEAYTKLGALLHMEEEAAVLSGFCEETYANTCAIMEQVGEENKVRTLYLQGDVGLNAVAKGTQHSEVLDLITANAAEIENPTGKGLGNEVSMEQIALWDPDFIIFGTESIYDSVEELPMWKELQAVKSGNYVETPDTPYCWMGTPVSVQRYLGLLWLPAVLYPEYCNYDLKEKVKEYYSLFYGCDLTDEQYEEITANAFLK